MEKVVIVGGGQAGFTVASELRSKGFAGEVHIVCAENALPYQRPPLSKGYLAGDLELERLHLRPESYYEENDITLHKGLVVNEVDTGDKQITAGETKLEYDHLVLATGAHPVRLPESIGGALDGVFEVRNLRDIDTLKTAVGGIKRLAVVGGGYIGLEAAAVASKLGIKVTVFEAADRILKRVACEETATFFRELHVSKGVEVNENASVAELIESDGHVAAVKLADGEVFETDAVIVGIGVRPTTDLAENIGVETSNGVAVDTQCQTNVADVWAVGDCASFPIGEKRVRLESVPNAIDMAGIVARNILGEDQHYTAKPWFWSDQFDVKLQIAGLNTGYDHVVTRKDAGKLSHWYFANGKLIAVDAMNDPKSFLMGRQLIERGLLATPEQVSDPSFNLKTLLA